MIEEETNLDYLIPGLQLHYGDIDGTLYSEAVYRTALVNGVKYLSRRWNGKYYIDSDNNVARSDTVTFTEESPPVIESNGDEYAIILAATVILRQVALTSSAGSFTNWSTPDLSVSSGSQERAYTTLYKDAVAALDAYFAKGLGTSRKRFMLTENLMYPTLIAPGSDALV